MDLHKKICSLTLLLVFFLIGTWTVSAATKPDLSQPYVNGSLIGAVYASSEYSPNYPVQNLQDGDRTTIWGSSATSTSEWVYTDLQRELPLAGVRLHWYDKYYAKSYQIGISQNGTDWNIIHTTNSGAGGMEEIAGAVTTRYIGILMTEKNSAAYALSEFEVYIDNKVITFEDEGMEYIFRSKLQKIEGDIRILEPSVLTSIVGTSRTVRTLNDLQYCPDLKEVHFWNNVIEDISVFRKLKHVTVINLKENRISDISSLQGLRDLTSLYMENNLIADISPLASLTNLAVINLNKNRISDIGILSRLTKLERLLLNNNKITDISALEPLVNLITLDLGYNTIIDVSPLRILPKLERLRLSYNFITDISPIPVLTYGYLYLDGNNITDICSLKHDGSYFFLDLADNKISDITCLSGFTQISYLDISQNVITDISPLSNLYIGGMDLSFNPLDDITPLATVDGVYNVDLYKTGITNIEALASKTHLSYLDISDTKVTDITILPTENLQRLEISNTGITDISRLENVITLKEFVAWNTPITSIEALRGLNNLYKLNIGGTKVTDITPLEAIPNLKELDLDNLGITSIDVIAKTRLLERIEISHNAIADLSPVESFNKIKYLNVNHNDMRIVEDGGQGTTNLNIINRLINAQKTVHYLEGNLTGKR